MTENTARYDHENFRRQKFLRHQTNQIVPIQKSFWEGKHT